MDRDLTPAERKLLLLGHLSKIATMLQEDVGLLAPEVAYQTHRFRDGDISLHELCFWHKSLIRAFFAFLEGLTYAIRDSLLANAAALGVELSAKARAALDLDRRLPLEKAVPLAFRQLAQLFGIEPTIDTGGEDFRGFKALTEARENFTHPKDHRDICPFKLFPTMSPALEWVLTAWKATLLSCTHALGHRAQATPLSRRFKYRDEAL